MNRDDFIARLKRTRQRRGYTKGDFSVAVGVHWRSVQDWESGIGLPRIDTLERIGRVLNVSLDWLVYGDEDRAADRF